MTAAIEHSIIIIAFGNVLHLLRGRRVMLSLYQCSLGTNEGK